MKQMIKKLAWILLALLLFSAGAAFGEDFRIDEKGVLQAYTGAETELAIPDGVTAIGDEAFLDQTSLTSVTLPEGLTSIGYAAFSGCTQLRSVTIPETLSFLDRSAFSGCASLEEIVLPYALREIPEYAFSGCTSLRRVQFPGGIRRIDDTAFEGCRNLTVIGYGKRSDSQAYAEKHGFSYDCIGDEWELPPVFAAISQRGNGRVYIRWKSVQKAKKYDLYEVGNDTPLYTVSSQSLTLQNVSLGRHSYYVVPSNGNGKYGNPSAIGTVEMIEWNWTAAPELEARQNGDGTVLLAWSADTVCTGFICYADGREKARTAEKTAVIDGISEGDHVFQVYPYYGNLDGTVAKGRGSAKVTVKMISGWDPSYSTAFHVETLHTQEDTLVIRWDSLPDQKAFTVCEQIGGKNAEDHPAESVGENRWEVTLTGLLPGTHTFRIYTMDGSKKGSWHQVQLKLQALWSRKVELSAELNEEGKLVLSWTPVQGQLPGSWRVTVSGVKEPFTVPGDESSLRFEDGEVPLKSGRKLTFRVVPVRDGKSGTPSVFSWKIP